MSRAFKVMTGVAAPLAGLILALWFASQWWETTFATRKHSAVSPDGCYRLEEYSPYWVLPASFHPARNPDKHWNPFWDWYAPWLMPELPGFYRLYDNQSGELLVQTEVYDLAFVGTGDALYTSDRYRNAGGSIGATGANDLDLACSAASPGSLR